MIYQNPNQYNANIKNTPCLDDSSRAQAGGCASKFDPFDGYFGYAGSGVNPAIHRGADYPRASADQRRAQLCFYHEPQYWHPNLRAVPVRPRSTCLCDVVNLVGF